MAPRRVPVAVELVQVDITSGHWRLALFQLLRSSIMGVELGDLDLGIPKQRCWQKLYLYGVCLKARQSKKKDQKGSKGPFQQVTATLSGSPITPDAKHSLQALAEAICTLQLPQELRSSRPDKNSVPSAQGIELKTISTSHGDIISCKLSALSEILRLHRYELLRVHL